MKNYSVIMTDEIHKQFLEHLIRNDDQEDLCFATYIPGTGSERSTAIIRSIIFPTDGERIVHGNVAFFPEYFERVLEVATSRNEGIIFIHSHLGPGWQGMSEDDKVAEQRMAPAVLAATDLPLVGMTVGTDGSWSARFYEKDEVQKRIYNLHWCENVRVLGTDLRVTFNDNILSPNFDSEKQLRTISAWGKKTQEDISRLKIGIVGLGSVGSIVAEILARSGFSNFILIDFDIVEKKNLDRQTNVFKTDIGRWKVDAIHDAILRSGSSPKISIKKVPYSICEKEGFEEGVNCDILFSCVDRPWPRQVLNFIAYSHLIPVVDGGIMVRTNGTNTKLIGADWKAQTVGYKRACLECLGQYKTENANLEKQGLLEDSSYIKDFKLDSVINAHENVFCFSTHLASLEVLQMLSLFIAPSGISNLGQQVHHFVLGAMESDTTKVCCKGCFFQTIEGKGDKTGIVVYGKHRKAEELRTGMF